MLSESLLIQMILFLYFILTYSNDSIFIEHFLFFYFAKVIVLNK